MPSFTVPHADGLQLHYEDHGTGHPVVLIHGWPLSGRSWEAQVPALVNSGHRVISYDRRGFGWSSQGHAGYDYDTLARDLQELIVRLDLSEATLVGFSMGGGEVARYIGAYGTERIAGAVFAAAVPPYLYRSEDNPEGGIDDATLEQFRAGVLGDRPAFLEGFIDGFFAAGDRHDLVSEAQKRYAFQIAVMASPQGTLDCIDGFARTDFREDLAKVDVPALVIHGDSDAIVPFEVSGRRTHAAIDGCELALVEGGPHGLNVSHADEFNAALLRFLGR
jgi:pimeloyl-ACP methyl ester carboxylesterase